MEYSPFMSTFVVLGILIVLTLFGSIAMKTLMEKRRIERARLLVDLHDDLTNMQSALALIPEVYLDTPSKIFILKRLMQLIDQVQETGNISESLSELNQDLSIQLEKALHIKDDSVKRLSQWVKIKDPESAHEIQSLVKFLHKQIIISVKTGLIPRAHGSRVVKNLKVIMHRIILDLNYSLASNYLKTNKLRPALGKLRAALSTTTRGPIKQYLKTQKEQLEKLITQTESKIINSRKKTNKTTANKLATGMDKIQEDDDWDNKKNLYD